MDSHADVVVVGAGPAGSAAAAWAARTGHDVLVIDAANFPRDKACGDGLTPRAVAELERLGLGEWLDARIRHRGLRMSGFGGEVEVDWPGPSFPSTGSAGPASSWTTGFAKSPRNPAHACDSASKLLVLIMIRRLG